MMFNRFYNMEMKNTSASAPSANAGSSCAHTACTSHTANTAMIAIMDAIIMASIIICGLIISRPACHRHDRDYYCDSGTGSRLGHSESKCALVL